MRVLVLTYWSFTDPLVQTYTLPHVERIKQELGAKGKVYLLTLEKPHLKLPADQKKKIKDQLKKQGIIWIPARYHAFGLQALLAFVPMILRLVALILFKKIKVIHTWCTPAGAIGWFLSVITRRKLVIDSYEPHAESMLENGTWTKRSLPFRFLIKLEKLQTKRASVCIGLTDITPEYSLKTYGISPKRYYKKPATVDLELFNPKIVKDYSLINEPDDCKKTICVYAGKTGGIYLDEEIYEFFKCCSDYWNGNFKAILITDMPCQFIEEKISKTGLSKEKIWFGKIDHSEIPKFMVLAHFALNPVKPVPSKRYCTSIKDSEYWATGLPVVITKDIADDSYIIEQNDIGAIISSLDKEGYYGAIRKVDNLLKNNISDDLKIKIRNIAIEKRNPDIADKIYKELYNSENGLLIKQQTRPVIVYCFHSLKDPLVEGLMLSYLIELNRDKVSSIIYLITLEQKPYKLSAVEKSILQKQLKELNILWKPFNYHGGNFILLKKAWDFVRVSLFISRLRIHKRARKIIGFLPIAGAFSAILGKLLMMKSFIYCFEPHSMYLVDFGSWKPNALKTKLLLYFEKFQIKKAEIVVVPTSYTKELILQWHPRVNAKVLPISVDTDLFQPYRNHEKSQQIRKKFNFLDEDKVFIYTGKLGGLYYSPESLALFIDAISKENPGYKFLIITNNPIEEVRNAFRIVNLPEDRYVVHPPVPYTELPFYISAADIGVLAIPPHPSQKYRTPVKTALYLACGIPYLTCKGIAEDDIIAEKHNVGISIPDLIPQYAKQTNIGVQNLFRDSQLSNRCRNLAVETRSKKLTKEILQDMMDC